MAEQTEVAGLEFENCKYNQGGDMFQKKLIVAAVAGAICAGATGLALAQAPRGDGDKMNRFGTSTTGNVEVYGFPGLFFRHQPRDGQVHGIPATDCG